MKSFISSTNFIVEILFPVFKGICPQRIIIFRNITFLKIELQSVLQILLYARAGSKNSSISGIAYDERADKNWCNVFSTPR